MSRPPPILGTLESALYADDLEEAIRFWTDTIGLECFQRVDGRHAFFRTASTPPQVLLVFRASATESPPKAGARFPVPSHGANGPGHYCLAVSPDLLDAWRDHLIISNVEIEADFEWPNGARSIYFRDPAGNSIELADPTIWTET
ncbi:VOC family protein (plasmid) [Paracoccus sp. TK19116]|uniref:VOC family protein n=1 Tax=Paracoccus albicereus TaxID=2922394 RepID=A0ABT1MKX6_9RHOB|nr:VOC family protein [Paracoccus albicereus]MCQ0968954.1 VOC family protein [Paracoccus albicereus]